MREGATDLGRIGEKGAQSEKGRKRGNRVRGEVKGYQREVGEELKEGAVDGRTERGSRLAGTGVVEQ